MMVLYHYTLAGDLFRMLSRQEEINVVVAKVQDSQHNALATPFDRFHEISRTQSKNWLFKRLMDEIKINRFEPVWKWEKWICTSWWKWPRQFEF